MKKKKRTPTIHSKSLLLAIAIAASAALGTSDVDAAHASPLSRIMKRISTGGSPAQTAHLLNIVRAMAPPEFPEWAKLAENAKHATLKGDAAATKSACNGCHDQYRDAYRSKQKSGGGGGGSGPVPVPIPVPTPAK